MGFFEGLSHIKTLGADTVQEFDAFYRRNLNARIRPVIVDFALFMMVINAGFNIAVQLQVHTHWGAVHPFAYVYLGAFLLLAALHGFSPLRQRALVSVYAIHIIVIAFAYRDFIAHDGWLEPVYGAFFLLAFVAYLCLAIRHALIIIASHLLALVLAYSWLPGQAGTTSSVLALLSERYVFTCLVTAITSVFFVHWLFRNLLAMQFLLNVKNAQLAATFKTLETTEKQLIAQQKHQALNLMSKGLLHEIINPLNSATQAIGFAQTLADDEDLKEALDHAQSQQARISTILYDLRRFAQTEQDHPLQTQELAKLVDTAARFCQADLRTHRIHMKVRIPEKLTLACHPSAVIQILVNLLTNAISALKEKPDNAEREICIACKEREESLLVIVRDNGAGMPPHALDKVFDPFFTQGKGEGHMGLGLSICETIMRHHQGSMQIKSQEHAWTEVTLVFPANITLPETSLSPVTPSAVTRTSKL